MTAGSARAALVRIHRFVRPCHGGFRIVVGAKFECAIGKAERYGLAVPDGRRGANLLRELIGLAMRLRLVGVAQKDREFVAADAADDVGVADIGEENLGEFKQRSIAAGMAMGVVDQDRKSVV